MAVQIAGTRVTRQETVRAVRLPRSVKNRPDFLLFTLPSGWDFVATKNDDDGVPTAGEWLPQLRPLPLMAGTQGCQQTGKDGKGPVDPTLAIAHITRTKHGSMLMPDDDRLGEFGNYVQWFPNDAGHKVHVTIFETPQRVGNTVHWKSDEVEVNRFRRHIVEIGITPELEEAHRDYLIDRAETNYQRRVDDGRDVKSLPMRSMKARIALMGQSCGPGRKRATAGKTSRKSA